MNFPLCETERKLSTAKWQGTAKAARYALRLSKAVFNNDDRQAVPDNDPQNAKRHSASALPPTRLRSTFTLLSVVRWIPSESSAILPRSNLGRLGSWLDANPVVHSRADALLAAEVSLRVWI